MSKKHQTTVPVTTVPIVHDRITTGYRDIPSDVSFDGFLSHVEGHDFTAQFPTFGKYQIFRSEIAVERSVGEFSAIEYGDGWSGVSGVLAFLWDKYLGKKFSNQMVANFVFQLLLSGVEKGWQAVVLAVRRNLGDESAATVADVVDGINRLHTEGGFEKIVTDIKIAQADINAPIESGKKPNFWQKALRFLKIIVTFGLSKSDTNATGK